MRTASRVRASRGASPQPPRHLLKLALVLSILAGMGCAPKPGAKTAEGKPAAAKGSDRPKTVDELWNEARTLKDPKERIRLREQLLSMLDDPEARQVVNSELVQDYAEVGDVEKMEAAAANVSIDEDYQGAQVRNAMAYAWAEKGVRLDKARQFIMAALNILDRMEAGQYLPPTVDPESEDFKEFIEENRGYFLDTLGWIDFKAGKGREAVAVLEEAARRVDHSTIRYHLGEAYVLVGDVPNALKAHALSVAMESEDSDKAKAALDRLVSEGKVTKEQVTKLIAEAKAEHAAKVEKQKADRKVREEKAREDQARRMEELKAEAARDALSYRKEEAAPEFGIQDFTGKTTDNKSLRRRVTVIDFWASWCGPCRLELPIYQGLFERYKDKGVDFLAVSVDDGKEEAVRFIEDENFSFPVAHDADGQMARSFRVTGLPTIYVIGPCGRINWVHRGFNPQIETILTAQIEQLLKETTLSCENEAKPPKK